jgi:hypothetical protein
MAKLDAQDSRVFRVFACDARRLTPARSPLSVRFNSPDPQKAVVSAVRALGTSEDPWSGPLRMVERNCWSQAA